MRKCCKPILFTFELDLLKGAVDGLQLDAKETLRQLQELKADQERLAKAAPPPAIGADPISTKKASKACNNRTPAPMLNQEKT
eukprot:g389.t1